MDQSAPKAMWQGCHDRVGRRVKGIACSVASRDPDVHHVGGEQRGRPSIRQVEVTAPEELLTERRRVRKFKRTTRDFGFARAHAVVKHGRLSCIESMVVEGFELHKQIVGLSDGQGITRLDAGERHGCKGRGGTVHDELNAGHDVRLVFGKAGKSSRPSLRSRYPERMLGTRRSKRIHRLRAGW